MKKIPHEARGTKPVLQFSVLCDGIGNPKELNNKLVLVGVFSTLLKPGAVPQFFIANRWIDGEGEHTETVRILDPDLKVLVATPAQPFTLLSRSQGHDVINGFTNLTFPRAGVYWIKVELDGKAVLSYPLPVFPDESSN